MLIVNVHILQIQSFVKSTKLNMVIHSLIAQAYIAYINMVLFIDKLHFQLYA